MIEAVLRTLGPRILAAALLGGALLCGRLALADAASLETLLAGALTPSASPALLGPISAEGRKGWDCKPERNAAAVDVQQAELPKATGSP
jgi:hypothetical protein